MCVCVCVFVQKPESGRVCLLHPRLLFLQLAQKDTIRSFRQGDLNLLISTSVAEEGLDIPECNLVVRYGLLTNEIAQKQASGRARARRSQYSVVAQRGGREERREHLNEYLDELTGQAIAVVQAMRPQELRRKVRDVRLRLALLATGGLPVISLCPLSR